MTEQRPTGKELADALVYALLEMIEARGSTVEIKDEGLLAYIKGDRFCLEYADGFVVCTPIDEIRRRGEKIEPEANEGIRRELRRKGFSS